MYLQIKYSSYPYRYLALLTALFVLLNTSVASSRSGPQYNPVSAARNRSIAVWVLPLFVGPA